MSKVGTLSFRFYTNDEVRSTPSSLLNSSLGIQVNQLQQSERAIQMSQVYVTLGAIDTYNTAIAVDLSPYLSPMPYRPQDEANFVVEVCFLDQGQSKYVMQLPVMEYLSNDPLLFTTPHPESLNLAFNIYPSNSGTNKDSLIGPAIAMIAKLKQGLGSNRESLVKNFTIPILKKNALAYIGSVTFCFLVVTP